MQTLSDKNLLLRFAYPIAGPPSIVSLCALFWKTVFMVAVWSVVGFILSAAVAYPVAAAWIAVGALGVVTWVALLAFTFGALEARSKAIRAGHVEVSTVTKLSKAAYYGIKERFCPVFRVVRTEQG